MKKELFLKQLLFDNMVLQRGLMVAPVVVMSYNLKNAVALCLAFAIITFVTVTVSSFLSRKLPYTLRVIFNVLLASLVFIPAAMLVEKLEQGLVYRLGIFLPLLVTNSLVVQKSETRFRRAPSKRYMVLDLILQIVGFAVVVCPIAILREWLVGGTVWGVTITGLPQEVPAVSLPFAGFIIIGLLAAFVNQYREHVVRKENGEVEQ